MLSGFTVTAALLSRPVLVPVPVPAPEAFIKFIANKFIVDNLAADIAVNDLISNDLISVSALPCVSGADCEVVAASVELLAVAFLLALPCRTFSFALVAF